MKKLLLIITLIASFSANAQVVQGIRGEFRDSVTSLTNNTDLVLKGKGTGLVNIEGAYTLPGSDGTNGQALTTNGSSTVSFSTVTVGGGGTGNTSFTAYAPIFGGTTSTGALQSGTAGTSGQVLTSNGAGALPTFQDATTVSFGTDNQVPFVNAGGTDFDYSSNFTFDGSTGTVAGQWNVDNVRLDGLTISTTTGNLILDPAGFGAVIPSDDNATNLGASAGNRWDTGFFGTDVVVAGSSVTTDADIGSTIQAWDAQLDDISGLAVTDGNIIVGNGANWVAESGATARTSLGLGTMATQNATSVNIDGGNIDGTPIAGSTGSFTTVNASGDVTLSGSSTRNLFLTHTTGSNLRLIAGGLESAVRTEDSTPLRLGANGSNFVTIEVDGSLTAGQITSTALTGTGTRLMNVTSGGAVGEITNGTDGQVMTMVSGSPAWSSSSSFTENTFTPTLVSSGGGESVTYAYQSGYYIRAGNQVTVWVSISPSSVSGGSGSAQIGGLPENFATFGGGRPDFIGNAMTNGVDFSAGYTQVLSRGESGGSTTLTLYQIGDNVSLTSLPFSAISNNDSIEITLTYVTD